MKPFASLVCLAPILTSCMLAQAPATPSPPLSVGAEVPTAVAATSVASGTTTAATALFSAEQLDQLLGPIALYPDALIALILPASTNASDVVLAARYLEDGGDPARVESQPWDESVQALARYPDVIKWMDQNLAWTKQLGDAFAAQPADVMNAIQRLRTRARDAGTLVDTPQQQVMVQDSAIVIVPTEPDVIYIPYYDPTIVYLPRLYSYSTPRTFFTFSAGFAVGSWLSFGIDWRERCVWNVGRRHREVFWREHRYVGPRQPPIVHVGSSSPSVHRWRPPSHRRLVAPSPARPSHVVRPTIWNGPRRDLPRVDSSPGRPHDANASRWNRPSRAAGNRTGPDAAAVGPMARSDAPTARSFSSRTPPSTPRMVPPLQQAPAAAIGSQDRHDLSVGPFERHDRPRVDRGTPPSRPSVRPTTPDGSWRHQRTPPSQAPASASAYATPRAAPPPMASPYLPRVSRPAPSSAPRPQYVRPAPPPRFAPSPTPPPASVSSGHDDSQRDSPSPSGSSARHHRD